MLTYNVSFTESEMEFLRQLFQSDLAITVKTVEVVASTKAKVMTAVSTTLASTD